MLLGYARFAARRGPLRLSERTINARRDGRRRSGGIAVRVTPVRRTLPGGALSRGMLIIEVFGDLILTVEPLKAGLRVWGLRVLDLLRRLLSGGRIIRGLWRPILNRYLLVQRLLVQRL